jgi:hypothetical protein
MRGIPSRRNEFGNTELRRVYRDASAMSKRVIRRRRGALAIRLSSGLALSAVPYNCLTVLEQQSY